MNHWWPLIFTSLAVQTAALALRFTPMPRVLSAVASLSAYLVASVAVACQARYAREPAWFLSCAVGLAVVGGLVAIGVNQPPPNWLLGGLVALCGLSYILGMMRRAAR